MIGDDKMSFIWYLVKQNLIKIRLKCTEQTSLAIKRSVSKPNCWLIGSQTNGNIGDQAIAESMLKFIESHIVGQLSRQIFMPFIMNLVNVCSSHEHTIPFIA